MITIVQRRVSRATRRFPEYCNGKRRYILPSQLTARVLSKHAEQNKDEKNSTRLFDITGMSCEVQDV